MANFDIDEMVFPQQSHEDKTMPELLKHLDEQEDVKPDSYMIQRIYFPEAKSKNAEG